MKIVGYAIFLLCCGGALVFWLWMLYDCLVNESDERGRVIWALPIFFGGIAIAGVYYGVRRTKREYGLRR